MKIGDTINIYEFYWKNGIKNHVGLKNQEEAFNYTNLKGIKHIKCVYRMRITKIKTDK